MDQWMEKIPRVYKVCGCMDLRAGNKAVAYVIIAINFFAILGTWVVIWQDEDDISKSLTELSKAIPELKPTDDDLKDAVDYILSVYGLAYTVGVLIYAGISYQFIKGVNENNTVYMIPYMTVYGIPALFCFAFAASCILLVPFFIGHFWDTILLMFIFLLVGGLISLIFVWAYSLYREMKEDNTKNLEAGTGGGYQL